MTGEGYTSMCHHGNRNPLFVVHTWSQRALDKLKEQTHRDRRRKREEAGGSGRVAEEGVVEADLPRLAAPRHVLIEPGW